MSGSSRPSKRIIPIILVAASLATLGVAGELKADPPSTPQPPALARLGARPSAEKLTPVERGRLLAGEVVSHPVKFEHDGGVYVGGVAQQLVRAQPEQVMAALENVQNLPRALPKTRSARLLSTSSRSARVELVQGNRFMQARYSVHLARQPGNGEIRFWLDRTRPHDIRDVWGFFRVQKFDPNRSLVSVGVSLDVGSGLVRMLFEDKIVRVILSTPRCIRDFVEPRARMADRLRRPEPS
ncbi:MAG TPA: SRPBCC family protein [Polyangiaceae bacterium]